MSTRIALVTPVRDELGTLPQLVAAIGAQTLPIDTWVVIENDSSDGSREYLDCLADELGSPRLIVRNLSFDDPAYALGKKYASIINAGFDELRALPDFASYDYIGILDADCVPEPDYYRKLVSFLDEDPRVGITSGVIYLPDGSPDPVSSEWARGGCRIWRKNCFDAAGYVVGPSADALSSAKAELRGWRTAVTASARIQSRETGARSGFEYYGKSAYFRGITPAYALARGLGSLFKRPRYAVEYLRGYFNAYASGMPRTSDREIIEYYSGYGVRKIQRMFRRSARVA